MRAPPSVQGAPSLPDLIHHHLTRCRTAPAPPPAQWQRRSRSRAAATSGSVHTTARGCRPQTRRLRVEGAASPSVRQHSPTPGSTAQPHPSPACHALSSWMQPCAREPPAPPPLLARRSPMWKVPLRRRVMRSAMALGAATPDVAGTNAAGQGRAGHAPHHHRMQLTWAAEPPDPAAAQAPCRLQASGPVAATSRGPRSCRPRDAMWLLGHQHPHPRSEGGGLACFRARPVDFGSSSVSSKGRTVFLPGGAAPLCPEIPPTWTSSRSSATATPAIVHWSLCCNMCLSLIQGRNEARAFRAAARAHDSAFQAPCNRWMTERA